MLGVKVSYANYKQVLMTLMQMSKSGLLLAFFFPKSFVMYFKVTLIVPFSVSQAHSADSAD